MEEPSGDKRSPFNELILDIEYDWTSARRLVGPSFANDLSVTGQPYVELVGDTPRLDEGMAFLTGKALFNRYAKDAVTGGNWQEPGSEALYWHSTPTIERARQGRYWGYRVTIRLLISDNPVVSRLVQDSLEQKRLDND